MNNYELQEFDQQVARASAALKQRPTRGAYTQILLAYRPQAPAE
jgi:hypothetical protein